jgi:type IV secretion system protein VirB4
MGGAHHALGLGESADRALAFQPLRRIHEPAERAGRPNGLQPAGA